MLSSQSRPVDTLSGDVIMLLVNMILQPNGSQSLISQFLAALHVHGPHDIPSLWLSSQTRPPHILIATDAQAVLSPRFKCVSHPF